MGIRRPTQCLEARAFGTKAGALARVKRAGRGRLGITGGLLLATLFAGSAFAARIPVDKSAPILIRALAYDRDLKNRAGPSVTLAVVYNPSSPTSVSESNTALAAFKQLESLTVQGLPFRATRLPYGPDLSAKITEQGIDAVFLVDGLSNELEAIVDLTRRRKIVTLTTEEADVRRGAAIGVVLADGKPTLMVNLAASTAEGAQLSSDLLRLAKVLR